MILISIFYLSKCLCSNYFENQTNIIQNKNLFYTQQGFYNIMIHNDDVIHISLNEGKQTLFFFMPYYPSFYIQNMSIDGIPVKNNMFPRGFFIKGNINASLEFCSGNKDYEMQANMWIIPSEICQKSSIFTYGSNSIKITSSITQLCIFSPTFDSSNQKFKIESGIPFDSSFHYTLIYTNNFSNPDFLNYGNKIETYKFKNGNLVKFYSSSPYYIENYTSSGLKSSNEYYSFFYKRKTKTGKIAFTQNECFSDSIYECDSKGCVYNRIPTNLLCFDYDIEAIVIVGSIIGAVFAIGMLVMISCFIVKKKKTKKENNGILNTVPLRNENSIADDYTNQNYPQTPKDVYEQDEYINPYNPSQSYNYLLQSPNIY